MNIIECVICDRLGDHSTVHLSQILYQDKFGFKWRVYWVSDNWGSYICDESNFRINFWKDEDMVKILFPLMKNHKPLNYLDILEKETK